MLDPRLLRAFVTIADDGGFTLAAERLHMTQSTISQQLVRLEDAVGHLLIDRAARPVRPTAAGERLLGHARRILILQAEAETLLSDAAGTASLRIGMPDDLFTPAMGQVFRGVRERHRELRLDVTIGLSRDLAGRFHAGEFDIIVVKEEAPTADHRATFAEPIGWFESTHAPASWGDPLPLVAFPAGGLYRDAMFERLERERMGWYVAFTGSSLASGLQAVEGRLGGTPRPAGGTAGPSVAPYPSLGQEQAMAVSVYAWEETGPIAELTELISGVLAQRRG